MRWLFPFQSKQSMSSRQASSEGRCNPTPSISDSLRFNYVPARSAPCVEPDFSQSLPTLLHHIHIQTSSSLKLERLATRRSKRLAWSQLYNNLQLCSAVPIHKLGLFASLFDGSNDDERSCVCSLISNDQESILRMITSCTARV